MLEIQHQRISPLDQRIDVGENTFFQCNTDGIAQFGFLGGPLSGSVRHINERTIVIHNTSAKDEGIYQCTGYYRDKNKYIHFLARAKLLVYSKTYLCTVSHIHLHFGKNELCIIFQTQRN